LIFLVKYAIRKGGSFKVGLGLWQLG